jgi:hypothetical protein
MPEVAGVNQRSDVTGLWSPEFRERRLPAAVLIAVGLAVIASVLMWETGRGPDDAPGGDYPAFYGAGRIVLDGDMADLYSLDRQAEAQRGLFGDEERDAAWYFAYPPQIAVVYAPLAALPYGWSYLVHTLLMALALAATVRLLQPMVPWLEGRFLPALAASLVFWPMFRAVTGGSNPALTGLLIVGAWRLVRDERPYLGGMVLALLWYKPQIALPLLGLFFVARRWRVVAGAAAVTVPFWMWGSALLGWGWVGDWAHLAGDFGRLDAEINGHSAISWLGFLQNWLGVDNTVAAVAGWGCAALTALALAWLWARRGRGGLDGALAVAIPGILLISPHAMSHESAIVLITVAVVLQRARGPRWMVAVVWLLGLAQVFILALGFSPGFVLLLVLLGWALVVFRGDLLGPGPAAAAVS